MPWKYALIIIIMRLRFLEKILYLKDFSMVKIWLPGTSFSDLSFNLKEIQYYCKSLIKCESTLLNCCNFSKFKEDNCQKFSEQDQIWIFNPYLHMQHYIPSNVREH
jgi:hypothetical protein